MFLAFLSQAVTSTGKVIGIDYYSEAKSLRRNDQEPRKKTRKLAQDSTFVKKCKEDPSIQKYLIKGH
jgi:hypothetical protein